MREIRLKLWCKERKSWVGIDKIYFGESGELYCVETDDKELYFPEKNDFELVNYTGLKDKNGVEIYEGDIIKTHFYSNPYVDEYGGFHEPIDSVVTAVVKNEGVCIPVLLADYQSVEVIGNIYEKPELLETKKD